MNALIEIMDLTKVSQNFPEQKSDEIERENFINTICTIFEGEYNVIVLETKEGMGKTTLLAQFTKRYPDNAISLFIKPSCSFAYDLGVVRLDLCNQINWILFQSEIQEPEFVDVAYMNQRLYELHRRAKRKHETIYFIIDGLDEIPLEDAFVQELIYKMLPVGLPSFKFLFSTQDGKISEILVKRKIKFKPLTLIGFTYDESSKFLKELNLNNNQLRELYHLSGGTPGDLLNIKRIILSGVSIEDIPEKLPELFKLEWSKINLEDESLIKLLALTSHDQKEHKITELSEIFQLSENKIKNMVDATSIIEIEPYKKTIKYVSESYKKSVSNELKNYKEIVNNILIDYFMKDPSSEDSLKYLPGYLNQANRLGEIINYLSPSNFSAIINYSKSLSIVLQKAELGVEVSKLLKRDGDLIRFTINKTIIFENEGTKFWYSEVKARMALNDYESAIALSQSTLLIEDRLHLLAIIARKQKEQGIFSESALNEQIQYLYHNVDHLTLGKRAIDIATELIYSNPELAIELIEKTTKSENSNTEVDWAFATLSLAAMNANKEDAQLGVTVESIMSRIKDPKAKRFSETASLLTKDFTADEVIFEAKKLESISDRLFFLRSWTKSNTEHEEAYLVIEYALMILIRTTEYSPNLRDLHELSIQLPFIRIAEKSRQLVNMIDAQKLIIENQGTTEHLVALELVLAETEMKYDIEASTNRIIDLYLKISIVDEVYVKTVCLAQLISSISRFDDTQELEKKDKLHSLSNMDFSTNFELLLNSTATHFAATKKIIETLSVNIPRLAFEISNKLNTEESRDKSKVELIEYAVDIPLKKIDLKFIESVILEINDEELSGEAVSNFFDRLKDSHDVVDVNFIQNLLPLISLIRSITHSEDRCRAICFTYIFIKKQPFYQEFNGILKQLLSELASSWNCIDLGWEKINVGFKITELLAKIDLENALLYMKDTEKYREEITFHDRKSSIAYLESIKLIIRSFAGLLPRNLNKNEDMDRIFQLISVIPSNGEKAVLWSDLALRCYGYQKNHECNTIVTEHIKPLLKNISKLDIRYLSKVTTLIAPALFVTHKTTAFEIINELSKKERDNAYFQICDYILTKKSFSDPYEGTPGRGYDINLEEIIDIIEILNKVDSDRIIYYFIIDLIDSMFDKKGKLKFTQQQTTDIYGRINLLITNKLPNKIHIQHDGFLIAAKAQVARIKTNFNEWDKLIELAMVIPNLADSVYVLCIIAVAMPLKELEKKLLLIKKAQEIIERIPVLLDRINHYETLATMALTFHTITSRICLEKAMKCATSINDPDLYPAQRRIIDLAHRIDPELATSLASSLDDDAARVKARKNINKRLEVHDLKRNILDDSKSNIINENMKISNYPKAAWMLLSSLNANRIKTLHVDQTRDILQAAAQLPISKAFSILHWVIENAVRRFSNTHESIEYLRPLFESTILATELSLHIASRFAFVLRPTIIKDVYANSSSILVNSGEREKAIQFLKNWMLNNVTEYLKICDPFFGPQDMEVLQLISEAVPSCEISILTSKKHQVNENIAQPWDSSYRDYWRLSISDQDPPVTEIVIAGTKNQGVLPIHDRWWITKGNGIRIGTSINSLGVDKVSEISILSEEESESREVEIDRYLKRIEKEHKGDKIQYVLFSLD